MLAAFCSSLPKVNQDSGKKKKGSKLSVSEIPHEREARHRGSEPSLRGVSVDPKKNIL
jgi:hypothetical protein